MACAQSCVSRSATTGGRPPGWKGAPGAAAQASWVGSEVNQCLYNLKHCQSDILLFTAKHCLPDINKCNGFKDTEPLSGRGAATGCPPTLCLVVSPADTPEGGQL